MLLFTTLASDDAEKSEDATTNLHTTLASNNAVRELKKLNNGSGPEK
jgi:hypothetical protein